VTETSAVAFVQSSTPKGISALSSAQPTPVAKKEEEEDDDKDPAMAGFMNMMTTLAIAEEQSGR
jgi:hypothetical protein